MSRSRWQEAITPPSILFQAAHDYRVLVFLVGFALLGASLAIAIYRRATTQEAECQFRVLAEAIPQIVWTAQPALGIDYINRRWSELTGTEARQAIGLGWQRALHPDDIPVALNNWSQSRNTGIPLHARYRFRDRAGNFRWHLVRATAMRDASGKIVKWFGCCTDIQDHVQTQEELERQIEQRTAALFEANARLQQESIRDALTGLYNRRYLDETLERETRRAVRAEGRLGVVMLDLDHFKNFNDSNGHEAGDVVLRETSALLTKSVRAEDVVCRYGGEEFVIILPMADLGTTRSRAERIRERFHLLSLRHQGRPIGALTASFGVAGLPSHGTTPQELLERADAALYRAKREGRDRVVTAEDGEEAF